MFNVTVRDVSYFRFTVRAFFVGLLFQRRLYLWVIVSLGQPTNCVFIFALYCVQQIASPCLFVICQNFWFRNLRKLNH